MAIGSLVYFLVYFLVFVLVLWLVWWAGNAIITLIPPPIQQVARVILIVLICLICIGALLSVLGEGGFGLSRNGRIGALSPQVEWSVV
jgi:DMSO/TMAO reductase YedYZ heme-binding membrane subunit